MPRQQSSRPRRVAAVSLLDKETEDKRELNAAQDEEVTENSDLEQNSVQDLSNNVDKTKNIPSNSRSFDKELDTLFHATEQDMQDLVREGEKAKSNVGRWRKDVQYLQRHTDDVLSFLNHADTSAQSVLELYASLLEDVRVERAGQIDEASVMLREQPAHRAESRRRTMTKFLALKEQNIENEKLATDANDLIAHYEALLKTI